jgi:hypothetical protein
MNYGRLGRRCEDLLIERIPSDHGSRRSRRTMMIRFPQNAHESEYPSDQSLIIMTAMIDSTVCAKWGETGMISFPKGKWEYIGLALAICHHRLGHSSSCHPRWAQSGVREGSMPALTE